MTNDICIFFFFFKQFRFHSSERIIFPCTLDIRVSRSSSKYWKYSDIKDWIESHEYEPFDLGFTRKSTMIYPPPHRPQNELVGEEEEEEAWCNSAGTKNQSRPTVVVWGVWRSVARFRAGWRRWAKDGEGEESRILSRYGCSSLSNSRDTR